ncbi:MAG: hypothetical protein ACOH1P_08205 [Lysobacter sp.]
MLAITWGSHTLIGDKRRAIYAPDTNFFIQCKDPGEIGWALVSDADEVQLVVLNEVHREIDRLKSGGNGRRAKRARAISSQLRGLVVSGEDEIEMRGSGPAVSLRLAPRLDPAREKPNGFDPTSADERIAEEAKACSDSFFNGELALLSHDGMPLRAAHLMGMPICAVPDEWLLPPEPSEQDRAIQKLNERLAALEKQAPRIEVRLDEEGESSITGTLVCFPPLSPEFLESVVDAIRSKFPIKRPSTGGMATASIENLFRGFDPSPTAAHIQKYETEYQEWLEKLEDFLSRLPRIHSLRGAAVEAFLVLSNSGSTPAEHLVVDVTAMGPVRLQEPVERDEREVPTLPHPPSPAPTRGFGSLFDNPIAPLFRDNFAGMRFPTPRAARDRHEFYWEFDDPERASRHCRGQCEDFRHGLKDERLQVLLTWDEPQSGTLAGAIKVVVSARNLPVPVERIFPVRIVGEQGDSEELLRSIVLEDIGVAV